MEGGLGIVRTGAGRSHLRRSGSIADIPASVPTPPPRSTRFGSPLVLSRMHWVRPELVAEVKFLTWTDDNLRRPGAPRGSYPLSPELEFSRIAS
jgi:bifunctional non-homologous end joining protein LigD